MKTRGLGRVYGRRYGPSPKESEPDKRPIIWWVEVWHRGKQHRESSGSTSRADAVRLLKRRHAEIHAGTFAPNAKNVTFEDLAAMLTNDYAAHGRRSLDCVKRSIAHLRRFFGSEQAVDITSDRGDAYIASRLSEKAAPATVRKEVAALSRMFTLAVKAGRVVVRPPFTRLRVQNTRAVAFTEAELDAVLDVLGRGRPATGIDPEVKAQPDLVPPIAFAAVTGWRMRSEVLRLQWRQVDFGAGTVWLERGTTKSGEPRVFPFGAVPKLAAVLHKQREATAGLERETGRIIPFVFHRHGERIVDLYAAWRAACRRAGVPGRVPHDLRRTAARALRALGLGDRDIAEACGWETMDMVTRYLGRDPFGVADRLRLKLAESEMRTRTIPARSAVGSDSRL